MVTLHDAPPRSRLCHPQQLGSVVHNQALGWEAHFLQLLRVRGGHFGTSDTGRRRLEVVECVLAGERHDFGTDAKGWEVGRDAEHVARLLDGFDNGLDVEGLDRAQVDDFGLDAVFGL
jgi:hypothetical protein